jgi:hypothetical protein
MADAWQEFRRRLARGDDPTLEEFRSFILNAPPPPPEMLGATVSIKRKRGAPYRWSDREVETIRNLCVRVRLWSEAETADDDGYCRPMSWEEIHRRVGAALREPMTAKALEKLLNRRQPTRRGMTLFREDDFRKVLGPP